jgi:hypothetical protein
MSAATTTTTDTHAANSTVVFDIFDRLVDGGEVSAKEEVFWTNYQEIVRSISTCSTVT